jgi:MoxR-like ATPase
MTTETYPASKYDYKRKFNPVVDLIKLSREQAVAGGDHPKNSPYHYDEEIILAVNTALAAERPLLVAGPAGTGKSALAANIANQLKWGYEAKVITGRTEARDLLWHFDAVRRLRDAHVLAGQQETPGEDVLNPRQYIERGVLWRAFTSEKRTVVLIDEIDKADPDVPNSLLEVLGNGEFTVEETGETVEISKSAPPFVVITTNDERELSRPFRRRCITLTLAAPAADRLVQIAERWNLASGVDHEIARGLAKDITDLASDTRGRGRITPNVAEYLDALRACLKLDVAPGSATWEGIKRAALLKDVELE